ncbi:vWA domain-containing protein [Sphingomonas sp. Leaf25]|uniref:vWA domain-containing protein n=1 Tax=Sphingomonas sp. Leaf25 TaxID=1735692 RepID=UPI0006FF14A1|nr:VWA domain-containing protein [Sphingomonas sp. Leaf25]KQN01455.1 hypothetical protein ASE78_17410 [Sphingomonas sp. Leaf25]
MLHDDFEQAPFGAIEFADNPEARCACLILMDVSGSMKGDPIAEANRGLQQFAEELREDRLASRRVDVAVITFGDKVDVVAQFGSAQTFYPQPLVANGSTPMGEAIETGVDLVAARQAEYRSNGIATYRPWIFLVTDGAPTDSWERAARRIRDGESRNSFSLFAVGVGGADMKTLSQISVKAPVALNGLAFGDMFRWLSSSLSAISRSSVGQAVALSNPAGPAGWATIV